MKILLTLVLVVGVGMTSTACGGKQVVVNHPGSVNKVDNALYDGILTFRTTITEAQRQFTGNRAVLDQINSRVLPPFNQLEVAYTAYHTALVAGTDNTQVLAQLQTQLVAVEAALVAIKGGTK